MSAAVSPISQKLPPLSQEAVNETKASVTLSVPSLHCAGCIRKAEAALNCLQGVEQARVNLTLRRVTALTDLPSERLIDCLKKAGFEAFALDVEKLADESDPVGRNLLLRLGVAGFAMMNVMLLSVAIWSGATDSTRDLFHLISAAIALPASLFAAQPFFSNAWSALRARGLNMDVPISLAIILSGAISLYEALNGGEHAYFDAALSLTFFLLIGRYLEYKTRSAARSAAKELSALEVYKTQLIIQGKAVTVPLCEVKAGDRVLVASSNRVPVDGELLSNEALTDRSFLTGESDPVSTLKTGHLKAGEINLGDPFELRADAVGEETSLRKLAHMVETAENVRNSYTSLADRAARIYAPAVHLLALITLIGWFWGTGDFRNSLNIAVAVLIITCPCALGLAIPAVATAAIGRLYRMGFLVKSATVLERLSETDCVIFDKTGTLTQPGFDFDFGRLSEEQKGITLGLAQSSAHPASKALADRLKDCTPAAVASLVEHPGSGIEGTFEGKKVQLGRAGWMGREGQGLVLRIGDCYWEFPQSETLRTGAVQACSGLTASGLRVGILSGDSQLRTSMLARLLEVKNWVAQMTPADKRVHIEDLAAKGNKTCMIGDGINDTAALAQAHASIAPGTALDAARNAADIVLIRRSLSDLPDLFTIAGKAMRLSRQNLIIAAMYNMVAIPIAMAGYATPLLAALAMSTSSITVLLNALRVRAGH